MSASFVNLGKEFIFQWKIENQCDCWNFKEIQSPKFAYGLKGSEWSVLLLPMGDQDKENIDLYLHRQTDCSGPNVITVFIELSFLGKKGSMLKERSGKFNFKKGDRLGFPDFEKKEKVFGFKRDTFIPENILIVQCRMWSVKETPKTKHASARTVLRSYQRSFVWKIEKFVDLYPASRNQIKVGFVNFDLVLNEQPGFETKMIMDLNSFDKCMKCFQFKISILDSEGKKVNCGMEDYLISDLKNNVLSLTLIFPEKLMDNKSQYLPSDVLSLDCEYSYVTENTSLFDHSREIGWNEKWYAVEKAKPQNSEILIQDLKSMFNDSTFYDIELRTTTRTFPAHKAIVSARSPVFSRMLNSDMKEKNTGHIDIVDLEAETVRRMLLYIYTDTLEDLQLESATDLYKAADKYEIMSLREKCSTFLKDNLRPTNVCDVLILADLYQDEDLKSAAQCYILEHDTVFNSLEWKYFMDNNKELAADTMYKKILKISDKINEHNAILSPSMPKFGHPW